MTTLARLMTKITALSDKAEEQFLELGNCLREVQESYPWEFGNALAKAGLGSRKAYYLVRMSKRFEGAKLPLGRFQKLGWTKTEVIAEHLTRANARELITLAEENTTRDLKRLVREEKPQPDAHCVLMYFSPAQYRQFEQAVLQNGGTRSGRGLLNKERALVTLIRQSLQPEKIDGGKSQSARGKRLR